MMNVLLPGMESAKKVALLLMFTSIESEEIIAAINNHLVDGASMAAAAALNGVPKGNLKRNLDTLNEMANIYEQLKVEERFSVK